MASFVEKVSIKFRGSNNEKSVNNAKMLFMFYCAYTSKTIKHAGLRLMLRGCVSWNGVGPLVKIMGNMDANYYVCITFEAVTLKK